MTISGAEVSEKGGFYVKQLLGTAERTGTCPWEQEPAFVDAKSFNALLAFLSYAAG